MIDSQRDKADPEIERKEIRTMLRLLRENFERGLYEGEEYQYWQKVGALKEKLSLFDRMPEYAINQAARTMLDLRETWKNASQGERKDLVQLLIQEVGCDVIGKTVHWIKVRPDYDPLFRLIGGLEVDKEGRHWLKSKQTAITILENRRDRGPVSVQTAMSHNALTTSQEHLNEKGTLKK